MLKQRNIQITLGIVGFCALLMGATLPMSPFSSLLKVPGLQQSEPLQQSAITPPSAAIAKAVARSPENRIRQLQALIRSGNALDRYRARYLLADDLIQRRDWRRAIALLDGLEQDYPILAAPIAHQRAQAYELSGNQAKATAAWQALLQRHPSDPVVVEALFALGRLEPQYWNQAIARFPEYPRTVEIARLRLRQDPEQLPLRLLIAEHGLHLPDYTDQLDQLVQEHAAQLTPANWETIAFGYWEKQAYGQAGEAYAQAPKTPQNQYRAARGLHLDYRGDDARQRYRQLVQDFPEAPETATALLRLAQLAPTDMTALPYLDQVIDHFPDQASEALLEKVRLLERLYGTEVAEPTRQRILEQHSQSDAAAELRWNNAERRAEVSNWRQSRHWAQEIVRLNPDSELAPQAAFWAGKWASRSGLEQKAQADFKLVLTRYPESYYAWRAARRLGSEVGDFVGVRQLEPQVNQPLARPILPTGSSTLQELYLLGQDEDAWTRWQVEFHNSREPSVSEQFTDGILRLGVADHLDGIYMIASLARRETPAEQTQYQTLREQPAHWHALYPFPYTEAIAHWSEQRQLNSLLVTALIRQESRFEPAIESVSGAVGLMQVMPETGAWIADQLELEQYRLDYPEDNIKLGTWYLDYTHEVYDNNSLLAVASYNAGPGNVADWVQRFGLSDPDRFVEQIPFPETRGYIKAVFGNYWNYLRLYNPEVSQTLAQYSPAHAQLAQQFEAGGG